VLVAGFWLAAGGCGDGIHSIGDLGQPIVTLSARVEGALPVGVGQSGLRAAMKWEVLEDGMLDCLDAAADQVAVARCVTAVGVEAIQATASVPIEPVFPASFEIPLYRLPGPEVLGGAEGAWFGYGVLLVYADGNQNEMLDLVDAQAVDSADTVLASGFPTEQLKAGVFVYREGELSPLWKIFAGLGCQEPGQGYSVLDVEASRLGVRCAVESSAEASIPVYFEDSASMRQQICQPQPISSTFPADPPPAGALLDCIFDDSLQFVADPSRYCQQVQRYDLVGCDSLVGCEVPTWDLRAEPPAWWPCTGERDGGFSLIDSGHELTGGQDDLFSIRYDSGDKRFSLLDLRVVVYPPSGVARSFSAPESIRFSDYDHDGLFGLQDVLEVVEPAGQDWFNPNHVGQRFEVQLVKSVSLVLDESLAELVWRP
jgi:hypothetical protein